MRKLLSVGALAAASLFTAWQPAAVAGQPVVIVRPHRHYYRHHGYWHHGRYYRGHDRGYDRGFYR